MRFLKSDVRVATLRALMLAADADVLKLHAGDAITGTLWYTIL